MAQHFVSVVKCIWCVLAINGGVLGTHSDLKLRIPFRNCLNKRRFFLLYMVFIRYLNSQTAKKPKLPQIKASQKPFNRDLQFFDWLLLKKKMLLIYFILYA